MIKLIKKGHKRRVGLELPSELLYKRFEKKLSKYKSIEIINGPEDKPKSLRYMMLSVDMKRFKEYNTIKMLEGSKEIKIEFEMDIYNYEYEFEIQSNKANEIKSYLDNNIKPSRIVEILSTKENITKVRVKLYRNEKDIEDHLKKEVEYVVKDLKIKLKKQTA